jgi:truncated hemoglobin YjbI
MFSNCTSIPYQYSNGILGVIRTSTDKDTDTSSSFEKNSTLTIVENSDVDTVEFTDIFQTKNSNKEQIDGEESIVDLVQRMALERRERTDNKNIPLEIIQAFEQAFKQAIKDVNPDFERRDELAAKLGKIVAKLESGRIPTEEEMNFLKERHPEYYRIASRMKQEVNQLRNQLKNCNTKEERSQVILQKMSQIASVAKTDPGYAQFMMVAVLKETNDTSTDDVTGWMADSLVI